MKKFICIYMVIVCAFLISCQSKEPVTEVKEEKEEEIVDVDKEYTIELNNGRKITGKIKYETENTRSNSHCC